MKETEIKEPGKTATIEEKQTYNQEVQNMQAVKDFGENAVIKKGKSLRQVNAAFGYDKNTERW